MNFLSIVILFFVMSYSKSYIQKKGAFSENNLLQVQSIFLRTFKQYVIKNQNADSVLIKKSVIGIKNSKQIVLNVNYSFTDIKDNTKLQKTVTAVIESTADANRWIVKKLITNTKEIQFKEEFVISL